MLAPGVSELSPQQRNAICTAVLSKSSCPEHANDLGPNGTQQMAENREPTSLLEYLQVQHHGALNEELG
ncbi:hypothetical protein CVT25_001553 [Psilocybe cyanescens]|uniref:Uncharacterized protein n=1 Tax=Psilocybe cyanescens TaxID=93625 RepID=A0A409WPV2_PSICY|nr:hypothetical protein CVT25_001553 [Psilocybe cyanescens]